MRKVTAGEPMLPHFTASWFNQTINLDKKFGKGDESKIDTRHQNIIYCVNEGSEVIDYLDPVHVNQRIKPESNNTTASYCELAWNEERTWGVAQQIIRPGAVGKVVVFGLTLANINLEWSHPVLEFQKVCLYDNKITESVHGPGQIVRYNFDGPSLITLGNYETRSGIAYLDDGAAPREGGEVGLGFGEDIIFSGYTLYSTGRILELINLSTEPVKKGYVQYKEVERSLVIDVAPCHEEEPNHLPLDP